MWRCRGSFALLVLALATATAKEEKGMKPTIECSCISSELGEEDIDFGCRRIPVQGSTESFPKAGYKMAYTAYSCDSDPRQEDHQNFDEYKLVHGLGYYKFHSELKTWDEANRMCRSEGAHLLIVDTEMELNTMKTIFSQYPEISADFWNNVQIWVGASDLIEEGTFVDIFGKPVKISSWFNWLDGQPDNREDEDCLTLMRVGKLNDDRCENKRAFICENKAF